MNPMENVRVINKDEKIIVGDFLIRPFDGAELLFTENDFKNLSKTTLQVIQDSLPIYRRNY